jgi:hypothetical protein
LADFVYRADKIEVTFLVILAFLRLIKNENILKAIINE